MKHNQVMNGAQIKFGAQSVQVSVTKTASLVLKIKSPFLRLFDKATLSA